MHPDDVPPSNYCLDCKTILPDDSDIRYCPHCGGKTAKYYSKYNMIFFIVVMIMCASICSAWYLFVP